METPRILDWLNSYSVKMIIVLILALVLLIPSFWIMEIIRERKQLQDNVEKELAALWGKNQELSGPVLNIPYSYYDDLEDLQESNETTAIAHFLPEQLKIQCELLPEIRKRGIYKLPVYQSNVRIESKFNVPDFAKLNINPKFVKWDEAYFTLGISDLRGVRNDLAVTINDESFEIIPGVEDNDLFQSGITIKTPTLNFSDGINFQSNIMLNGSADFQVEPFGKTSDIEMKSAWSDPSFIGAFLPANYDVSEDGFKANWTVTHINRNFPQQWISNKYKKRDSSLGVKLLMPIDHYQKTTRSAKYAILFIALNFIVFLFIEIRNKKRIHPFQYSLVALALLLFYTLLTSIGEQIGFNAAFSISALAISGLITWYSYSILKKIKPTISIAALQIALYVFLFTILQLQDYALLMGSIGLFIILGIIMKASQKIKWYND